MVDYGQDEFEEEVLMLFYRVEPERREEFIALLRKFAEAEGRVPAVPEQSFSIAL